MQILAPPSALGREGGRAQDSISAVAGATPSQGPGACGSQAHPCAMSTHVCRRVPRPCAHACATRMHVPRAHAGAEPMPMPCAGTCQAHTGAMLMRVPSPCLRHAHARAMRMKVPCACASRTHVLKVLHHAHTGAMRLHAGVKRDSSPCTGHAGAGAMRTNMPCACRRKAHACTTRTQGPDAHWFQVHLQGLLLATRDHQKAEIDSATVSSEAPPNFTTTKNIMCTRCPLATPHVPSPLQPSGLLFSRKGFQTRLGSS